MCIQGHALSVLLVMSCRFECKSDGSYLQIMHVSLEKANEDPEESTYTGPVSATQLLQQMTHQPQLRNTTQPVSKQCGSYTMVCDITRPASCLLCACSLISAPLHVLSFKQELLNNH